MYLDKNASIGRLSTTVPGERAYATIMPNVRINVQPASAELVAVSEGVFGQTSLGFLSVSGLEIGDLVTISGTGDKYVVKGVNDWFMLPLPHLEVVLFKADM